MKTFAVRTPCSVWSNIPGQQPKRYGQWSGAGSAAARHLVVWHAQRLLKIGAVDLHSFDARRLLLVPSISQALGWQGLLTWAASASEWDVARSLCDRNCSSHCYQKDALLDCTNLFTWFDFDSRESRLSCKKSIPWPFWAAGKAE